MKKSILFIIVFLLVVIPLKVFAVETTKEDTTCNYNSQAYLNKIAASVKMAYEFKYNEKGEASFDISIYNIKEDIYISLIDSNGKETKIFPNMTSGGTYVFHTSNITDIITYTAAVRTLKFGCINDIRKITLIKPKKNEVSNNSLCENEYANKLMYCQEWITQEFAVSEEDAIDIIQREIAKHEQNGNESETEKTPEQLIEEKNRRMKRLKNILIVTLLIGIVIDSIVIVLMTYRLRRYDI